MTCGLAQKEVATLLSFLTSFPKNLKECKSVLIAALHCKQLKKIYIAM
jgi:hypothetical protein